MKLKNNNFHPERKGLKVALQLETMGGEQTLFREKMSFNSNQASVSCTLLHNENMISAESKTITYK